MTTVIDYLRNLEKGDKIFLLVGGVTIDGTFDALLDDCVVLTDVKSPSIKKKHYTLKVPVDNIYAWGEKEKGDKKKKKSEA